MAGGVGSQPVLGWHCCVIYRPCAAVRRSRARQPRWTANVTWKMRVLFTCVTAVLVWASASRASETDALSISANIQARHMPFGTLLDPIFASPTSDQIIGYTRCG